MYDQIDSTARACKEVGIKGILAKGVLDVAGSGSERIDIFKQNYREYNSDDIKVVLGPHAIYTCSTDFLKSV